MSIDASVAVKNYGLAGYVWYANYGSNLNATRFNCYISGGIPNGGSRDYVGCTDQTPPLAYMPVDLPQELYFAGESKVWTGGLAFIGHERTNNTTKGRAYLITQTQFEEVVAQESWRDEPNPIDMGMLRELGHITLGDGSGNYDELIFCGDHVDGFPIVSFTSPYPHQPPSKPADTYVRMIGSGLVEAHGLEAKQAAFYLSTKTGISGSFTLNELIELIQ